MSQHDYFLDDATGAVFRSDLNDALAAAVTNNSGATEPTTMYAHMWWADTTAGLLKQRNTANDAWITVRSLAGAATAGSFTTLGATGNVTLGDATTDTVTVNGYMGVGGAASSDTKLYVRGTGLTGTSQYGVYCGITGTSAGTTSLSALETFPQTSASAYTISDVFGLRATSGAKGAGSTITNMHAVYIADQTQGTNNYGITSAVSSGANKWNIYASGTANNAFAGNVRIGGTTAPTVAMDVTGAISATTTGTFGTASTGSGYTLIKYSGADQQIEQQRWSGAGSDFAGTRVVSTLIGGGRADWQLWTANTATIAGQTFAQRISVNSDGLAVTGAISATATAATDTTAFSATGSTTRFNRGRIYNTGGDIRFGVEASISNQALTGSTAYSSFIGSFTNTPLHLVSNSAIIGTVSSTGIDVTGAISATTGISVTSTTSVIGVDITDGNNTNNNTFAQFTSNSAQCGTIKRVGTTAAVVYNTTSDYRLKANPQPLTGSGSFIDALQPKKWDWVDGSGSAAGFIAHEFQLVSPSSVSGEKDAVTAEGVPEYQSMQASSSEVMANIIAELQSLRLRVAQLESAAGL